MFVDELVSLITSLTSYQMAEDQWTLILSIKTCSVPCSMISRQSSVEDSILLLKMTRFLVGMEPTLQVIQKISPILTR